MTSLCVIAALSVGVYVLDPIEAAVSRKVDTCFGWPDDPARTIAACDAILERELSVKHRGEARFYTGLAYDLSGDDAQALTQYDLAEVDIPTRRAIFWNRAWIHKRSGDWGRAIADAQTVLASDGPSREEPGMHKVLAQAYGAVGRRADALEQFDLYLELRPDDLRMRRARADLLSRRADGAVALDAKLLRLQDLTYLLAHAPRKTAAQQETHANDALERTGVLTTLQLVGLAHRDWTATKAQIEVWAADTEVLDLAGAALSQMMGVLKDRTAQCGAPDATEHAQLGCVLDRYRLGDVDGAIEGLEAFLETDPTHPEAASLEMFKAVRVALVASGLPTGIGPP